MWYILVQLGSLNNTRSMVSGVTCSGVRVQKKADRLESYRAGKLEGLKAQRLPSFRVSWPSSCAL
jgi:hypothetical protein